MRLAFTALASVLAAGCGESGTYTLYRNSLVSEAKIHVATFDASNGSASGQYNSDNCAIAAKLFSDQPGVKTKFWCEPGAAKK